MSNPILITGTSSALGKLMTETLIKSGHYRPRLHAGLRWT